MKNDTERVSSVALCNKSTIQMHTIIELAFKKRAITSYYGVSNFNAG